MSEQPCLFLRIPQNCLRNSYKRAGVPPRIKFKQLKRKLSAKAKLTLPTIGTLFTNLWTSTIWSGRIVLNIFKQLFHLCRFRYCLTRIIVFLRMSVHMVAQTPTCDWVVRRAFHQTSNWVSQKLNDTNISLHPLLSHLVTSFQILFPFQQHRVVLHDKGRSNLSDACGYRTIFSETLSYGCPTTQQVGCHCCETWTRTKAVCKSETYSVIRPRFHWNPTKNCVQLVHMIEDEAYGCLTLTKVQ